MFQLSDIGLCVIF